MEIEILGMNFSCVLSSLGNGKFPESDCLIPLFSKILGYCIVSASVIVKVPQIYKILKHNSVRGLSVASFELEVVGFTIALAYCLHKGLPFSAYGELFFLLLQAIILVVIIYYYSQPLGAKIWIKAALYCAIAPTILAGQIDSILFEALYASQHAIFIFARIPQIWENYTIILVDCWICTRFLSYSRLDNFTEGCALFFCTITVRGPALTIIVLFDIQPLEQKHWGTQLLDNFHELWWFFCDFGIHERYFAAWYHFGSNAFMPKISSSKGEETRVKRGKGFSHIPDVDASSTKATRTSHVQ